MRIFVMWLLAEQKSSRKMSDLVYVFVLQRHYTNAWVLRTTGRWHLGQA